MGKQNQSTYELEDVNVGERGFVCPSSLGILDEDGHGYLSSEGQDFAEH